MGRGDAAGRTASSWAFASPTTAAGGAEAQAPGDLLESFRPYLLSIARRGLPDDLHGKYDAADLVQEVLLEAHRGLAGFDGADSDAFRAWLCGIMRHNVLDLIRRYRDSSRRAIGRERSLADGSGSGDLGDPSVDPHPTPCTQSIAREDIRALREAMSLLPADEHAVVLLRHFDGLPYEEIGRSMGRSPEAARKLGARAMLRLQRLLKTTRGARA